MHSGLPPFVITIETGFKEFHVNDRSVQNPVTWFGGKDKAAYDVLVKEHYRHVFGACFAMLANVHDAEDAAQETMLKGFLKIRTLDDTERFRPWIVRVARNLCIDRLRRQSRRKLPVEKPASLSRQDLDAQYDLEQAIKRLPQELRLPLLMFYFNGRNAKSIAASMNISHSGACQKLRMARQQLHQLLTERVQR